MSRPCRVFYEFLLPGTSGTPSGERPTPDFGAAYVLGVLGSRISLGSVLGPESVGDSLFLCPSVILCLKKKVPFFPPFVSVFPGRPYSPTHWTQQPPASPVNNWRLVSHLLRTSWWRSPLAAPRLPQGASQITRAPTPPSHPGPCALARGSPRHSRFRNNGTEHARV